VNVNHAIRAWQNLHECAKISHPHNFAGIDAAQLGCFGDGFDALTCIFAPSPLVAAM